MKDYEVSLIIMIFWNNVQINNSQQDQEHCKFR